MKLVRLKLRGPAPFWILKPIELREGHEFSPLLDVDLLSDPQKEIINNAILSQEISLYNATGAPIEGDLGSMRVLCANVVSDEDIEFEEDTIPEIVSITVDNEEDEEEEEEVFASDEVLEEASLLMTNHGQTIKRTVRAMPHAKESLALLQACLQLEIESGKNRPGVRTAIEKAISEY